MILGDFGNTIERHITKHYPHFRRLPKAKRRFLVDATIRYSFRLINARDYEKAFRAVTEHKIRLIELRRSLLSDGYVMKNIKLYLYYAHVNNRTDLRDVEKAFRIKLRDRMLYKTLLPETRRKLDEFKKPAKVLGKDKIEVRERPGFKAMTLYGFDEACVSALKQIKNFTRKFVNRKMKFIMTSDAQETHDIAAHLEMNGLQAVMLYYPAFESMDHLKNIMKRTVHNSGINYIEKHTSEKRGRISRDANGVFAAKVLPLHSAAVEQELGTIENGTLIDGSREDTFSLRITVEKLLSKFSDKRQQFLHLLMGSYHEEFSAYLRELGATSVDNDLYWDREADLTNYIQHALNFLDVSIATGDKFVNHLRKVLADFREAA